VEDIEKRIRDKIQGIEEVAAKPTDLMTDFFTALNKKYSVDTNQDELGAEVTSPARGSLEQPQEDAPAAAAEEVPTSVARQEATEKASEGTQREEEVEMVGEENPTVQLE
jgi:hypothetical protein